MAGAINRERNQTQCNLCAIQGSRNVQGRRVGRAGAADDSRGLAALEPPRDPTAANRGECQKPARYPHTTPTTSPSAVRGKRVALLIGNADYGSAPLRNPPNDVDVMAGALKKLGFKVNPVTNANQKQMKIAVRDFGEQAQGAEVALL